MFGFLALALLVPFVSVPRLSQPVYVAVDGRALSFSSHKRTVAEVLDEAQIVVGEGDRVAPAPGTAIWPGIQITVTRAIPLTISIAGDQREVRLPAVTVGEALIQLDVAVGPQDRVAPDPSTVLAPGMRITVERRESRQWIERGTIPFVTKAVFDRDLFKGEQVVQSPGRPGVRDRTVLVQYVNGHVVAQQTTAETIVRPSAPRIVTVGTRPVIAGQGPFAGKEIMSLEATAYYPGPNNFGGPVGTRTAIGMVAKRGVVAVDPAVIKLGTRLHVDGYGDAVAGDTGGAIRGYRIDLCFDTYEEAIQFGRRPVKVYILGAP
jgi:3D (Asp-Asp-Asp) domain-containing protein